MSYRLVDMVLKSDLTDPTEVAVMVAIASFSDKYCSCYPSIQALCERSRYKERAVQSATKRLIGRGVLAVKVGRGRGGANFYTIIPSALKPAFNAPFEDGKTRSKCGVTDEENPHLTTLKPASDDIKPALNAPESTNEPVNNQSTITRATEKPVVVDELSKRRDEVLRLMGLDGVIRPDGRQTGMTNDMAEMSKWDALGLTRQEQDAKIREMLDKQRTKFPGFFPNGWRWFTVGMNELAAAKDQGSAKAQPIEFANPEAEAERKVIDGQWAALADRTDSAAAAERQALMDRYRNLKSAAGAR